MIERGWWRIAFFGEKVPIWVNSTFARLRLRKLKVKNGARNDEGGHKEPTRPIIGVRGTGAEVPGKILSPVPDASSTNYVIYFALII